MGTATTKTELLRTIRKELSKEYVEFDIFGLPYKKYVAPIFSQDGDPCIVIEFIYHTGTTIVKGRKEGYTTWSSAFDPALGLVDELGDDLTDEFGETLEA